MKFYFLIPVRMESSRFFGKPLKLIDNKPVLHWVYDNCSKSRFSKKTIIVTDSIKIKKYCESNNLNIMITGKHNCASNRIAEAASKLNSNYVVEVQGDEPFLWKSMIDNWLNQCLKIINSKINNKIDIFVSIAKLDHKLSSNPNYVKVYFGKDKVIKWFSRSKIPSDWKGQKASPFFRHTGFHLWKRKSLLKFAKIKPTYLEISEDTHATRLIENNFTPYANMIEDTISIDQPYDLIKAKKYIKNVR